MQAAVLHGHSVEVIKDIKIINRCTHPEPRLSHSMLLYATLCYKDMRAGDQKRILSSYLDGVKTPGVTLAANASVERVGEPATTRLGKP